MKKTFKKTNTCIAILKQKNGKLIMAGDRRATASETFFYTLTEPKVVKNNGLLIGGSGLSYLCDLFCKVLNPSPIHPEMSTFDYMHNIFYEDVMRLLSHKGYIINGETKFPDFFSASVLIGIRGDIYELVVDSSVGIMIDSGIPLPYAIGCGAESAISSLKTTESSKKLSAQDRLILALGVTAEMNPGCDMNIDFIEE